jgi:hypothetical protein
VALEELDGALVLLGGRSRAERAEISPSTSSQIDFPRIQPILTRLQLADHRSLLELSLSILNPTRKLVPTHEELTAELLSGSCEFGQKFAPH